jgi:hypothetical protein
MVYWGTTQTARGPAEGVVSDPGRWRRSFLVVDQVIRPNQWPPAEGSDVSNLQSVFAEGESHIATAESAVNSDSWDSVFCTDPDIAEALSTGMAKAPFRAFSRMSADQAGKWIWGTATLSIRQRERKRSKQSKGSKGSKRSRLSMGGSSA